MSNKIRWGICSTGSIAGQFAEAFTNVDSDEAEIVAVASRSAEAANAFGEKWNIERRHATYEALANDDEVDVVYVATPHSRHLEDTVMMLNGGRHVLCEKPFALSVAESEEMMAAAAANNRFLMEAQWARFHPGYIKLREIIDSGAIGTPQMVEANFAFRVPPEGRDDHRLFDPHRAGGALLDVGVYPVHMAMFVLGDVDRVQAAATLTDQGVDEQVGLVLGHSNGGLSVLSAAVGTWGTNTARIAGTDGHIDVHAFMHAFRGMTLNVAGEATEIEHGPPSLHWQALEVNQCLRDGLLESPRMSHKHTLDIMAVLDQARSQIGVIYPGNR